MSVLNGKTGKINEAKKKKRETDKYTITEILKNVLLITDGTSRQRIALLCLS